MESKKNSTFSIMKGIAIISVVIGHCANHYTHGSSYIEPFVNQYHLAVFIFVAGYFFKEKYLAAPIEFVIKRIKSLYIPFVLSGLCFLLLHNLLYLVYINGDQLSLDDLMEGAIALFFRLYSTENMMGAMWFCPYLLVLSIVGLSGFYLANVLNKKTKMGETACSTFVFILFVVIGSIALHILNLRRPYCIWQIFVVSFLFYEGWLFRNHLESYVIEKNKITKLLVGVLFFCLLCILTKNGVMARLQTDCIINENELCIILIGFVGSLMVYCISSIIDKSIIGKYIVIAGDYSFSIMLLHFLAFRLVNMLQCLILICH